MTTLRTWLAAWFWARWAELWRWVDRELVHTPVGLPEWRVRRWYDDMVTGQYVVEIYRGGEWFAGAGAPSAVMAWRVARQQARARLRAMRSIGRAKQDEQVQA